MNDRTKKKPEMSPSPEAKIFNRAYMKPIPGGETIELSPKKCDHNDGSWLARSHVTGRLYAFDPNTQMQKDIWLMSVRENHDLAIDCLVWFCKPCGTVQKP